jgi:hypothetical protein
MVVPELFVWAMLADQAEDGLDMGLVTLMHAACVDFSHNAWLWPALAGNA